MINALTEKTYRPFNNSIEMVKEFRRVGLNSQTGAMIIEKETRKQYWIAGLDEAYLKIVEDIPLAQRIQPFAICNWYTAFKKFTFTDGTPFGTTENDTTKIAHNAELSKIRQKWMSKKT